MGIYNIRINLRPPWSTRSARLNCEYNLNTRMHRRLDRRQIGSVRCIQTSFLHQMSRFLLLAWMYCQSNPLCGWNELSALICWDTNCMYSYARVLCILIHCRIMLGYSSTLRFAGDFARVLSEFSDTHHLILQVSRSLCIINIPLRYEH